MIEIRFVTDVRDPVLAAHAEVVRVWRPDAPRRVRVLTADAAQTDRLERLLWEEPREGFIPHVRIDSPLASVTPVLVDHAAEHPGAGDLLINLAAKPPLFFARFLELIELVGRDPDAVAAGRERWRHYKARGFALTHQRAAPV
ncbi:MAG: DNA polymerase III subunit chi [Casimicrobiaceae bacterium]